MVTAEEGRRDRLRQQLLPRQHPHRGYGHLEAALRQITGTLFKGTFQVIGQSLTDVETRDLKSRYFMPIAQDQLAGR